MSSEEINQNSLKLQIYQTLKEVKLAGASVAKTTELFGASRSTVSKVMPAFEKEGKTFPLKQNS